METDRELALEWWNNISDFGKMTLIRMHNLVTNMHSITGREIEEIWNKEKVIDIDWKNV